MLDPDDPREGVFYGALTESEQRKSERFSSNRGRSRYVFAHGMLRTILGCYMNRSPREVGITHGPFGKPSLAEPPAGHEITFSLSHSYDIVLCAFSLGRRVGIDVEHVRLIEGFRDIVENYFSPVERSAILSAPVEEQLNVFFRAWTRKECLLKACGAGFSFDLDRFSVPIEALPYFQNLGDIISTHTSWSICDVKLEPTYIASLAVEGGPCAVSHWSWNEYSSATS